MPSPILQRNGNFKSNFNALTSNGSVMTFENTMQKVITSFVILLIGAGIGWFIPVLAMPAIILGLVLGLVNAFKKEPSPPLILAYSIVEGVAVGAISSIFTELFPGIVMQAILATLCVIGVTLFMYRTGIIKTTPKLTKIVLIAMFGYLAFSIVNMVLMFTGAVDDAWGLRSATIFGIPLGLILGVFAVLLGAYSLVMDFELMDQGIANGLEERYGWTVAFGITLTVVWIYLEILRMIGIARS